jgi:Ca2+-binding RTX toxin-like protein
MTAAVIANLGLAALTSGVHTGFISTGGDFIKNFENILGSKFNDTLTGDAGNNNIQGGLGNDTIAGGDGDDVLDGGFGASALVPGSDTVSYASAAAGVTVDLSLTSQQNTVGAGKDTLSGFENLTGSNSGDALTGNALANIIDGALGDDIIEGGLGNDTLKGGGVANNLGNDTVTYEHSSAGVTVSLAITAAQNTIGAGADILSGFENLTGGTGNDTLTGDAKANIINGGAGNDTLIGGAGNDQLHGGTGVNTVSYLGSAQGVTVVLGLNGELDANGGSASGGDAKGDTGDGFANITGSAAADRLTGNASDNVIEGGGGADVLDGGGGNDTLSYASSAAAATVDLGLAALASGPNAGFISTGGDFIKNFENILGGLGADLLTGDGIANVISGGAGNDTIEGRGGGDTLDGGLGVNTLSYVHDTAGVTIDLLAGTASGGEAAGDSISNFQNVTGGIGADHLSGDGNANIILGGAGDDVLSGGAGNDIITGGDGNDTIDGGLGDDKLTADGGTAAGAGTSDTVSYASIAANVTVSLAIASAQATGGAGKDALSGFENLTGGSGNDMLTGDAKANIIIGGDGNDSIIGGAGSDTLTGGNGSDAFRYNAPAEGGTSGDNIQDFTSGQDLISILKSGFAIAAGVSHGGAGNNNFDTQYFTATGVATAAGHGQFIFNDTSHQLFWDSDGAGAKAAVLIATLTNGATLHAADFELR